MHREFRNVHAAAALPLPLRRRISGRKSRFLVRAVSAQNVATAQVRPRFCVYICRHGRTGPFPFFHDEALFINAEFWR